ncbi:MAG: hypothetical protein BWZ06_00348 [Bacteroidetes bacterium ADurb.BinA261]|nr:MAG: hypothetical protein BWZ06_00348 [Bacteroidetes bacterium ADurb.BinA261]
MDVHNNFVKSFGFQLFDYELQKWFSTHLNQCFRHHIGEWFQPSAHACRENHGFHLIIFFEIPVPDFARDARERLLLRIFSRCALPHVVQHTPNGAARRYNQMQSSDA